MRLNASQRHALGLMSETAWLGAAEVGVQGSTQIALERRGLVEVRVAKAGRPWVRCVARLTPAGVELRDKLRPLSSLSDDELIARHTRGEMPLKAYGDEMERRSRLRAVAYTTVAVS